MMIQEVENALLYWVMVKVLPLIWPLTPPRRKSSVFHYCWVRVEAIPHGTFVRGFSY